MGTKTPPGGGGVADFVKLATSFGFELRTQLGGVSLGALALCHKVTPGSTAWLLARRRLHAPITSVRILFLRARSPRQTISRPTASKEPPALDSGCDRSLVGVSAARDPLTHLRDWPEQARRLFFPSAA